MTSPLLDQLKARISATGPITVAEYMASCLGDPKAGYYMQQEPFGTAGDFITAPEISQIFGELIGAFCLQSAETLGIFEPFQLVELGPGRGTLMADMLRVASLRPDFLQNANLNLAETSERLREKQRETLRQSPLRPIHRDTFADVPDGPLIVVANEFFDALPIHQYVKAGENWHERMVGMDDKGALTFGLGNGQLPAGAIPFSAQGAPEGAILETQPAANAICEEIAERISRFGGLALFIDYGYLKTAPGDTLQALYKHAYDDVLAHPGKADLTAHVNFEALARAAKNAGAHPHPPLTQGDFLLKMGLLERAGSLGSGKDTEAQDAIRNAVERLAAPDQMGDLFKVLAITRAAVPLHPFDKS
ncbi:class I SAM-dependent methyltransferase [Roseibium sediminis]|uniref:class I SAM-dependent methyltransferase n=1 Tax=Roseibium sediminis TaxID=1775174 RepID=UPI00123DCF86|nr:class I SAM-dependent methyltransferase [Roseibium sediminis]